MASRKVRAAIGPVGEKRWMVNLGVGRIEEDPRMESLWIRLVRPEREKLDEILVRKRGRGKQLVVREGMQV
jgi:hypothetical protein